MFANALAQPAISAAVFSAVIVIMQNGRLAARPDPDRSKGAYGLMPARRFAYAAGAA